MSPKKSSYMVAQGFWNNQPLVQPTSHSNLNYSILVQYVNVDDCNWHWSIGKNVICNPQEPVHLTGSDALEGLFIPSRASHLSQQCTPFEQQPWKSLLIYFPSCVVVVWQCSCIAVKQLMDHRQTSLGMFLGSMAASLPYTELSFIKLHVLN